MNDHLRADGTATAQALATRVLSRFWNSARSVGPAGDQHDEAGQSRHPHRKMAIHSV